MLSMHTTFSAGRVGYITGLSKFAIKEWMTHTLPLLAFPISLSLSTYVHAKHYTYTAFTRLVKERCTMTIVNKKDHRYAINTAQKVRK